MIRKFFAVLFILFFIFIMPPLLILESVVDSFLNESSVVNSVVPGSYQPVVEAIATKFAQKPEDTKLFTDRIRTILPSETYVEIMKEAVHPIFENIEKFDENNQTILISTEKLKSLAKERLPEIIKRFPLCESVELKTEDFRFCMPRGSGMNKQIESSANQFIGKNPDQIKFEIGKEKPDIARLISAVLIAKQYVKFIIAAIAIFILSIIALIIFSPFKSVLKWIGVPLLYLALLITLFIISVTRLLQNEALFQNIPDFQRDFIRLFVNFPLQSLTQWAFVIGILGIILFIIGVLIKAQPAKKH